MPRRLLSAGLRQPGDGVVCGEGWTQLARRGHYWGHCSPCREVCHPEPEEESLGLWKSPGLGSKDYLGAGAACVRTFSVLFFRCLLRCMASPKTLTLFGSCAVAVSGR